MLRRGFYHVFYLFAGLLAALIVGIAILVVALSRGPVSLAFLVPTLEGLIEREIGPFRFDFSGLDLQWRGWERGLSLIINEVRLSEDSGSVTATVPRAAIMLAPSALLTERVLPLRVEMIGPSIQLLRDREHDPIRILKEWLAAQASPAGSEPTEEDVLAPLRLREVGVLYATIRLHDRELDRAWLAEIKEARVAPNPVGLAGRLFARLVSGEDIASVSVVGQYAPASDQLAADVSVTNFPPRMLAGLTPELAPLADVDLTVATTTQFTVIDGRLTQIATDTSATGGSVTLTADMARRLGLPETAAQRVAIRSLALRGAADPEAPTLVLEQLAVRLADGQDILVPAPVGHRFPVRGLAAAATLRDGKLALGPLVVDFAGPVLTASGRADNVPQAPKGTLEASFAGLTADDLPRLWPASLGSNAHEWITTNIRDAVFRTFQARLAFDSPKGEVTVTSLDGALAFEGGTISYLPPLAPLRNVNGRAALTLETITVAIDGGDVSGLGLRLSEGTVLFPDLNADIPHLELTTRIDGPARGFVAFVNTPPYDFAGEAGILPMNVTGGLRSRLTLRLPLLDDVRIEEIDLRLDARTLDLAIREVRPGIDLGRGNADLRLTLDGMTVDGVVAVNGVDGRIEFLQSFNIGDRLQTRIVFDAPHAGIPQVLAETKPYVDLTDYLVSGALAASVRAEIDNARTTRIDAHFDLAHSVVAVPELGWRKEFGPAATIDTTVVVQGEHLASIPSVRVIAPNLDVEGSARFSPSGLASRIDVTRLVSGRTDVTANISQVDPNLWNIVLVGPSIDLAPFLATRDRDGDGGEPVNVSVSADVARVWTSETGGLQNVELMAVYENETLEMTQLSANLPGGANVALSILPDTPRSRSLVASIDNMGNFLLATDLLTQVRGGKLRVTGWFDDSLPDRPLAGTLEVRDFRLVNAPILARVLGAMAFQSLISTLRGRGITFNELRAQFEYRAGQLTLRHGLMRGASLGVVAEGSIDIDNERIDLEGVAIPFYWINGAVGRIPVIGDWLTGDQPGGGIFSASYRVTGPLDDPSVSVNVFTAFLPSVVRYILELLADWLSPSPPPTVNGLVNGLP